MSVLNALRERRSGVYVRELAEELDISTKQLGRDLDELGERHTIEIIERRPKRVQLVDPKMRDVHVTVRERFSLAAARNVFEAMSDTPLYQDLLSMYLKLVESLPESQRDALDGLKRRFAFIPDGGVKPYLDKEDVINALLTGVTAHRRVDFAYRSLAGRESKGTLEPYGMALYRQGLYLVGKRAGDATALVFAVERFTHAKHRKNDAFEPPPGFDVRGYFEGAFGPFVGGEKTDVRLLFSKQVADVVRSRMYHRTQQLIERAAGKLELRFTVTKTPQLVPWVLSWGRHARVLAPVWLRDAVAVEVAAMSKGRR